MVGVEPSGLGFSFMRNLQHSVLQRFEETLHIGSLQVFELGVEEMAEKQDFFQSLILRYL